MSAGEDSIRCVELVELVTEYLDGALPPVGRRRIEAHLEECDGCTAYVEQIRATIAVAGEVDAEAVPAPMLERLLAVFREGGRA